MYESLQLIHIVFAVATISGFLLRGLWMIQGSILLQHRLTRVLPHIVDTVFLLSGVGLILVLHLEVMQNSWLLLKFAALVVYILLGSVALKRGSTIKVRVVAFLAALLTFAYIAGVALSKSLQSWLAIL
jgi:uncharacterized membrane protein SirB2